MELVKVKSKGKPPKFTEKQVERMRHMKSEGLRHWEIANLLGVATATISAYIRGDKKVRPC